MIGYTMPTHLVNLDALIRREDFESGTEGANTSDPPLFKLEELESSRLYFKAIRKPDFQRETSNWAAETIAEFVRSFLDRELIPALILWHSKQTGKIFVIDGAHRLSALIAWVNDDYGDGKISRAFFNHKIPPTQVNFHNQTKALIESKVGSFQKLLDIGLEKSKPESPDDLRRALSIANLKPHIQIVEGSAEIAEKSFFKINGTPTTIDPTELDIIRARKKPNAIATRALMRAGTGHKYWGGFADNSEKIEKLAEKTHEVLFGQLHAIGAQSPDIPRAGEPYSEDAFRMLFDIVNVFNKLTPAMWQEQKSRKPDKKPRVEALGDDKTGDATLACLSTVLRIGNLVSDNSYAGCLGFDHAVYSYGATGRFHSGAYIASLMFAQELDAARRLKEFTSIRNGFEEFLVRHHHFINALGHSKGSRLRAVDSILELHRTIMEALLSGKQNDEEILAQILSKPQLMALGTIAQEELAPKNSHKRFSKAVEQAAVINATLATRERCPLCGARLPPNARSKDHRVRMEDGGLGTLQNLQFTHPYCNTGYKESFQREQR